MNTIKLELEAEEYGVVERFAEVLGVAPGDVAYAALHRLMTTCDDPAVGRDIVETRAWRRHHLPAWSGPAHSTHAYGGRTDDEQGRHRFW
jgi:hypothetical protein